MKFMTKFDLRNPNSLSGVVSREADKKREEEKKQRAGMIAKAFIETASSLPPEQQGDVNAIFEAVKTKLPPNSTEAEIMTGLKFADYVWERQNQQKQNKRQDVLAGQQQEMYDQGKLDRATKESDLNAMLGILDPESYQGGNEYQTPSASPDELKRMMSGEGKLGLMKYNADVENQNKKNALERRKLELEEKKANKGEDRDSEKRKFIAELTKSDEFLYMSPEEQNAALKRRAEIFDTSVWPVGGSNPVGTATPNPTAKPMDKKSILDKIFGGNTEEQQKPENITKQNEQPSIQKSGFLNRPWESTPLGKTENAVKAIPSVIKKAGEVIERSSISNKEALESAEKNRTYGSSIPGLSTSKKDQGSYRPDGTKKGNGYLGEIKNKDGSVSTELTIGVNIDGREIDIPLIVPTLNEEEIYILQSGKKPTREMIQKAVDHAKKRLSEGKSVYAD